MNEEAVASLCLGQSMSGLDTGKTFPLIGALVTTTPLDRNNHVPVEFLQFPRIKYCRIDPAPLIHWVATGHHCGISKFPQLLSPFLKACIIENSDGKLRCHLSIETLTPL